MSAPAEGSGKAGAVKPKDPYVDLAERIYVQLASRVFGTLAGGDQKKPDPKALAAFCYKLADAFEAASDETPRRLAEIVARDKAAVKLDQVDISSMFAANPNVAPAKPAAPATPPPVKK